MRVVVSDELIAHLFSPGERSHYRVTKGVPHDAVVVNVHRCFDTGRVEFMFAHQSFPVVLGGFAVPQMQVEFTSLIIDDPQPEIVLPRGKSSNYTGPTAEQLPRGWFSDCDGPKSPPPPPGYPATIENG